MNGALDGGVFRQLIAAAKAQGNPRIVFLSSLFAGSPDPRSANCTRTRKT